MFYSIIVQSIRAEIPFSSNRLSRLQPRIVIKRALMTFLKGKIAVLGNLPCDLSGDRTGVSRGTAKVPSLRPCAKGFLGD